MTRPGTVHLVGAGPGAIGLLTLRGAELLRTADVVLHDRLVLPELLELAPPTAKLVDVGKGADGHGMKQAEINALLIQYAATHHRVVRLKGGDPFVFGRGSEELEACAQAGIECEVVPGVTSAIGGPALAGIPVTSRGIARSFGVVTARSMAGTSDYRPDYGALARLDTVVVLMGCKDLAETAEALIAAGKSPDTPAALIERASWPDQRVTSAPLHAIAAAAHSANVRAPVLLVVGPAAQPTTAAQPLAGKRVLATRPRGAQIDLVRRLRNLGAEVIEYPLIRITYISPPPKITPETLNVDVIAFTSLHGVRGFFTALAASGLDARAIGPAKIATVGPRTAAELWDAARLTPDILPTESRAAALVEELTRTLPPNSTFLFPCGTLAREELPTGLRAAAHTVHELEVYETHPVPPTPDLAQQIQSNLHAILLYSPSAAKAIAPILTPTTPAQIICVGPTTAQTLQSLSPQTTPTTAKTYGDNGVIDALLGKQNTA
jgi:uroporphyrinogen III methyltransferase/synthase